jgi:hypothetical protein
MRTLIISILLMLVLGFAGLLETAIYLIGAVLVLALFATLLTSPIWLLYYLHKWTGGK